MLNIMATLKASSQGLTRIKQARSRKGWATSDFRWVESASELLGASWAKDGILAVGISEGTWKRFLAGKYPINEEAFRAYCKVLGLNWEEVVEEVRGQGGADGSDREGKDSREDEKSSVPPVAPNIDWGDAPDVSIFYGRQPELSAVKQWVIQERCRLVTLLGMGGIGKTTLSVKLTKEILGTYEFSGLSSEFGSSTQSSNFKFQNFEFVIWISLRNAPSVEEILAKTIQFFSQQQETTLPTNLEDRIALLFRYLRNSRCLIILDNVESILQAGDRTGRYRTGYEGYGQLLRCVTEIAHQSCVILTSREKPQGLTKFEGENLPVRSLQLNGLPEDDGRKLFNAKGNFAATEPEWQTLISRYAGNPLALKIVASSIHDYFDNNIAYFLETTQQSPFLFDDIRDLLSQQFRRLTDLERDIMYWLAIDREPITLPELQSNFVTPIPTREVLESLNSLQRRSLIEKSSNSFTQQPVVMEYVTMQLIEQVCEEIEGADLTQNSKFKIQNFVTHTLLKATAKDYIRETQANLIVQPVIDQLTATLGSADNIGIRLSQILEKLRGKTGKETGYAAGNTINLLYQAGLDLTGLDCSQLTVWQAYLQGVAVHDVDFTNSDLSRCAFTETLGNILWATFSPDGQLLATCDTDCNVRVWEVKSGRLLLICRGHTNWVRFVVFSPDGKTLASCGADCTIKLWNLQDGVCIKTFVGHEHEVFAVSYSPDGQKLASVSGDHKVKLWDFRDGHCLNTFTGHTNWVRSVVFSPDGKTLATGGADNTVKLWDVSTEKCLRTLIEHTGWVRSVAFSPDGEVLVSASSDRTIKLWDYETGECLRTYTGHQGSIYSIAFSSTGDVIVSGSGDCTVKFWDCYSNDCVRTLYGQTNEVCCVAVSSDNQTIACVSLDQTMRLWNFHSGHCLKSWYGNTDWALPVAFSPDGKTLASGSNDKTVKLWNWQSGNCVRSLAGHTDFIYGVAFSPDGQVLASASTDSTIRLWSVNTGQCFQILQGHADWIFTVAFHPKYPILGSGSADCSLKLWDWHTGQCLKTFIGHTDKIFGIAFSLDGCVLASASADQTIRLWSYSTGGCIATLNGHTNRVYAVAFSPDGETLASCSTDQIVKLWNWKTGECLKSFKGHSNWVFSVAFSPDGKTLASAAHDQTVRHWNITTSDCLNIFAGHSHLVSSVAFSPTGDTIASGSQDQTIRLWSVRTGKCDRVLIAKRLYEGMKLIGVKGLTQATISTLETLGAIIS